MKTNTQVEELRGVVDKLLSMMKVEEYGVVPQSETLNKIMDLFAHKLEIKEQEVREQERKIRLCGELYTKKEMELAKIESYKNGYIDGGIDTLKSGGLDVGTIHIDDMVDIDPEIRKEIDDHFFELIDTNGDK